MVHAKLLRPIGHLSAIGGGGGVGHADVPDDDPPGGEGQLGGDGGQLPLQLLQPGSLLTLVGVLWGWWWWRGVV